MTSEHKPRDIKSYDKGAYYGAPPDYSKVRVGTVFKNRAELAEARIHMETQKGIYACKDGAYAVVVNGGYPEDEDKGIEVDYAGEGMGNQSLDSTSNAGLLSSFRKQTPVRLIRGSKANPKYAPPEPYFVYHGEYDVVGEPKVRTRTDGTKALIFPLKRRSDQDPLPETGLQTRLKFWQRPKDDEVEQYERIGSAPKSKIPPGRIPKKQSSSNA